LVDAQSEGPDYTICVFRVGVGKSYVHKYNEADGLESIPPKEGYDSIYLESPNPSRVFQMRYLLHNAEHVTLTHIIKCGIEVEELQASLDLPTCKLCTAPAAVYCEEDRAFFCTACDELAHPEEEAEALGDLKSRRLYALRGDHHRSSIQESRPHRFGQCSRHRER
jgi:hypothetical protein